MKKTFYTPQGSVTRELTPQEITDFANHGDTDAKLEISKTEYDLAATSVDKLDVIAKYLGLIK